MNQRLDHRNGSPHRHSAIGSHHALGKCAQDAGEDVGTYVARAVALQMVVDQRADSASVEKLMAHLAEARAIVELPIANLSMVTNDTDRLRALHGTALLDFPPDPVYDRITRASRPCFQEPPGGARRHPGRLSRHTAD